jgi:hypothetical protein
MLSVQPPTVDPSQQAWPWWQLLPIYPYGRRVTLMRELIVGRVWCFEQLHGVWYVAVPIRMTVLKVEGGLLLYSPLPPTAELLSMLRSLENQYGPVISIVLATSSGLEHKLPTAALSRAFPAAIVWVSDKQWSFPVSLPSSWLGFPAARTKVLFRDGLPHQDQLVWLSLGPIELGLGTFHEIACIDLVTGSLLVTDSLVAISKTPPPVFELDPTPLLFHGREKGSEALVDTPLQRLKGWKRIVLFANYFRPDSVSIAPLVDILADARAAEQANRRNHFGLYPFRWDPSWEDQADQLIQHCNGITPCCLAPVLERLVFVRAKKCYQDWLRKLAEQTAIKSLISAHYTAAIALSPDHLAHYADSIDQRDWAPSQGAWQTLASIDQALTRLRLVPQ